jgi:hypothetical protein
VLILLSLGSLENRNAENPAAFYIIDAECRWVLLVLVVLAQSIEVVMRSRNTAMKSILLMLRST